jgi:predicted MPP superfamily phosphohydrolase
MYLYIAGNMYVFFKGWRSLRGVSFPVKCTAGLAYLCVSLLLFASYHNRGGHLPESLRTLLYPAGSAWLLAIMYMTFILLATDILRIFRIRLKYAFVVAAALTACILMYGSWHYKNPVVRELQVHIDKPLAGGGKALRVVAMSDLHLGQGTGKKMLKKYVGLVNGQQPDLILIGGDLVDNSLQLLYEQRMYEELSQLKAPLGVYMSPGNHDYFGGGIELVRRFVEETPIVLLQDSLVMLPGGLQLLGRDDRRAKRRSLDEWKPDIIPGKPVIMLDHQPYNLAQTAEAGIDIQFSGHTHRGQVWPLSLIADHVFELSYGYRLEGSSHICVSSGLSLWGPAFRIGTDSEIVVFNITFG